MSQLSHTLASFSIVAGINACLLEEAFGYHVGCVITVDARSLHGVTEVHF